MRPGRAAGALLLAALAGGVAYASGGDSPAPPSAPPGATVPSSLVPTPVVMVDPALRPSSTTQPASKADPMAVAWEGLQAWGRFAVSGELDTVAPWFAQDGPQWEQFRREAGELSTDAPGARPYTVLMAEPRLSGRGEEARVRARVTFVRTGEPSQTFRWEIILRRDGDGWEIWTVEEAQLESSTPSISIP